MAPPNYRINQPTGAGTGTLNTSRPTGLWLDQEVELVTTEVGTLLWEIEEAPPGSSATLSQAEQATALITPDVANLPWRIRLTVGTGSLARTRVFVMGVTKDSGGVAVGREWMPPAVGEQTGEDNASSTNGERGYAPRIEAIFDDVRDNLGGGGGGGGRQVFWEEGAVSPTAPVYNSFDDAFAAATALVAQVKDVVEIVVTADSAPVSLPAGTYDCQNLIELRGWRGMKTSRVELAVNVDTNLRNPRALRNFFIDVTGLTTPWITTSPGSDLLLILDNTRINDNSAGADMCTLASGTTGNKLQLLNGSVYQGDSHAFTTLSAGKILTVYLDSGTLGSESFHGSAGGVTVYQGTAGSIETQATFSGTFSVLSDVVTALGQVPTSVSVNDQRITNLASPTSGTNAANRNWVDGAASVSVAGSGSVTLSSGNVTTGAVALTGALTGDRTVTLPSGQRGLWLYNGTTGLYTLRIDGPSGGFCYLLPGQSRRVYVDASGILRGDALYLCETEIDVSLVGIGSGDTTTSLCRLPARFALERCERMTIVAPDGDGEYNDSVGFTGSAYDDILSNNAYPMAAVWGLASATEWGSGFSNGYSYSASARTLVYLINGFNQTVGNTVGTVRVRVAGRYFGA
jgi:hypothetical protein